MEGFFWGEKELSLLEAAPGGRQGHASNVTGSTGFLCAGDVPSLCGSLWSRKILGAILAPKIWEGSRGHTGLCLGAHLSHQPEHFTAFPNRAAFWYC